jgi:hypothetical protein
MLTPSTTIVIPVKTGIQETKEQNWIPACAGMTDKRTRGSTSSRQYVKEPLASKARVVQCGIFPSFLPDGRQERRKNEFRRSG